MNLDSTESSKFDALTNINACRRLGNKNSAENLDSKSHLFLFYSNLQHTEKMLEKSNLNIGSLQGLLDEQFIQLEELQDDANPNFVEEIVTLHYRDSSRLISSIEQAL